MPYKEDPYNTGTAVVPQAASTAQFVSVNLTELMRCLGLYERKIGELQTKVENLEIQQQKQEKAKKKNPGAIDSEWFTEYEQSVWRIHEKNALEDMGGGKFRWTVSQFDQRTKDAKEVAAAVDTDCYAIQSQKFYTAPGGYCMLLIFYPIGCGDDKNDHMSLYYHIAQGENDNDYNLSWPFKKTVTFTLVDQDCPKREYSKKIGYNKSFPKIFDKPVSEKNPSFGWPVWVKWADVKNKHSVMRNNQMVIDIKIS